MLEDLSESFLEHVDVPQSLALFLHALFHEEGNLEGMDQWDLKQGIDDQLELKWWIVWFMFQREKSGRYGSRSLKQGMDDQFVLNGVNSLVHVPERETWKVWIKKVQNNVCMTNLAVKWRILCSVWFIFQRDELEMCGSRRFKMSYELANLALK